MTMDIGMDIGNVVNMKSFAHVTGTVTCYYGKPGKDETYVFMFMGTEKDGEALDLVAVMNKLGWTVATPAISHPTENIELGAS